MTKFIITVVVLLALLVGAIVMLDNAKVVKSTPTPEAVASASSSPVVSDYGTTGNIKVSAPKVADEIGLPVVIKGEARTFEAAFSYRVKNGKGEVLVEGNGMSTGAADYPDFRPFEVTVNYPDPKTASGSIEVFEYSAKDGSEINKVSVPVMFKKDVASSVVKLYFDLEKPVTRRIAKSDTPVRAGLDALLMGVYKTDSPDGKMVSSISSDVRINSVALKSGVLTIDLSGTLNATAKSQFTKTAMQFASVKSVIITLDGKPS